MEEGFGKDYKPLAEPPEEEIDERFRYRWLMFAVTGAIAVIVAFLFVIVPKVERERGGPAEVGATIFPVYDIVRNIAGDSVKVGLVLPPLASPHTYEPTPSQLVEMRDVTLYFAIGHGLDRWAEGVFGTQAEKVIVDEGIAIIASDDRHRDGSDLGDADHDDEEEDDHDEGGTDPHYWLTIPNAKVIARTVSMELVRKFPEHEESFERNLARYLERLELAENGIRDGFSEVLKRDMITLHDSWYYFAIAYGFDIAGTFEPTPGREPTPRYLADLSAAIERTGVRTLYSEPQIPTQGIRTFAEDHGLEIAELDPIGGIAGRTTFIELMEYNAETIRSHQD